MQRPALILLLLVVGCDDPVKPAPRAGVKTREQPEPVSPPTGISVIQRDTEGIDKDLTALEKAGSADPSLVGMILNRISKLEIAVDLAVKAEARDMVRARRAQLLKDQSELMKKKTDAYGEIGEVQKMLDDYSKNGTPLPKGFTETELRDRLTDLRAEAEKLDREQEALKDELIEQDDLMNAENIPPQGETLFTREREALRGLRERAEALR